MGYPIKTCARDDDESCRMVGEPYRPHPVLGIDDFPPPSGPVTPVDTT